MLSVDIRIDRDRNLQTFTEEFGGYDQSPPPTETPMFLVLNYDDDNNNGTLDARDGTVIIDPMEREVRTLRIYDIHGRWTPYAPSTGRIKIDIPSGIQLHVPPGLTPVHQFGEDDEIDLFDRLMDDEDGQDYQDLIMEGVDPTSADARITVRVTTLDGLGEWGRSTIALITGRGDLDGHTPSNPISSDHNGRSPLSYWDVIEHNAVADQRDGLVHAVGFTRTEDDHPGRYTRASAADLTYVSVAKQEGPLLETTYCLIADVDDGRGYLDDYRMGCSTSVYWFPSQPVNPRPVPFRNYLGYYEMAYTNPQGYEVLPTVVNLYICVYDYVSDYNGTSGEEMHWLMEGTDGRPSPGFPGGPPWEYSGSIDPFAEGTIWAQEGG